MALELVQACCLRTSDRDDDPSLAGATDPQVVAAASTTSDGFNWSDAGIGASIAFGAALMLLMAVILGRRFRSRPTGLAST